jgi:hypothetical protein
MESSWAKGLTIDRINNDGDYEKSNCKWSTREEQSQNTRQNVKITCEAANWMRFCYELMGWCHNVSRTSVRNILRNRNIAVMTKAAFLRQLKQAVSCPRIHETRDKS